MDYSIEKLAEMAGAKRFGTTEARISRLLTDSRSLSFPEETLFFALKTDRNDGHRYIDNLYQRGVRNFVVSALPDSWILEKQGIKNSNNQELKYSDANFLVVDNTLKALGQIARQHREAFNIPVLAITGSNGKTIVKEWIYQLLSKDVATTRSPRSYNSQIGVPLSLWNIDERTKLAVFEAGISQKGEMERLEQMIQPNIGLLTHVGVAHQENFSTKREKVIEKLKLFKNVDTLIYCEDNDTVNTAVKEQCKCKLFSWSQKNEKATLYVANVEKHPDSTTVSFRYKGEELSYTLPFIDNASVENSVGALCFTLLWGANTETVIREMAHLEPVAMRLEVKEGQHGCTLINDAYNSDIHSLEIALDFMSRRPDHNGRKRTLIISDIEQSGMTDEDLYGEVAQLIELKNVEKIIGIGPHISAYSHLFSTQNKHFFATSEAFARSKEIRQIRDEVVLLKGARRFGFERLTDLLVKKVHETILEVNLDAIVENLNYYRSFLNPSTKLVCMIKADAYGAGATEVAKTLQDHQVDYLAVAVADEGVTLRRNGITANIMVMNPEMSSFKTLFDYGLEPEVYSFRLLKALIEAAEREGISGYPVHVKLDTGMHRLGFHPVDDIEELISTLKRQHAVTPRSVFSHFVGSDDDQFDDFSASQYELFLKGSSRLQSVFSHKILRHICNSAGIEHFPERQMDMCRLGLGLYGISPRGNRLLSNVSTLKTTILQMRTVKATDTVGYSRRGTLNRDSVIAAIPIGYADGLNRHLGRGKCYCLVNGKPAPYVGNICMDVAMIDVTGIDCHEGDTVEIFGNNLPVTVLSDATDTIPYEILTGVSNRVKRVYYHT